MWKSNKHFMGTNSYKSPNYDPLTGNTTNLAEPIGYGKPVSIENLHILNMLFYNSIIQKLLLPDHQRNVKCCVSEDVNIVNKNVSFLHVSDVRHKKSDLVC